jgi:ABC-2 type transport system ATP-binding protein
LTINARKEIGFMPENTYLYKHLTGREFLEFNGNFFSFEKDELKEKIKNLLKKVGLKDAENKLL